MDKRAVISVAALLVLGAGIGLIWRKLERAPEAELAQAPDDVGTMRAAPAGAPPTAQADQEPSAAREGSGVRAGLPQTPESPEYLEQRAAARRRLAELYPDLAAELQLEPNEADRLLDMLAQQQADIAGFIAARSDTIRDGVYPARLLRQVADLELAGNAEQAALLEGKYPDWLQHQQAGLQQNPVEQLRGTLQRQGTELPDELIDSLNNALAVEQGRISREGSRSAGPPDHGPRRLLEQELLFAANSAELLKAASRYLNAQQLETYAQLLEQRRLAARRLLGTTPGAAAE